LQDILLSGLPNSATLLPSNRNILLTAEDNHTADQRCSHEFQNWHASFQEESTDATVKDV